jgi:hypothetical protein
VASDQRAQLQRQLDERWSQLYGNDPDVVLATLAEAFEDNEAPAAAVAVDGAELALVVLVPGPNAIFDRVPTRTQAGNLTFRKVLKSERSGLYTTLVFGQLLVTLREAFAVAPGITAIRSVVLRHAGVNAYGKPQLECMFAGRFLRSAFDGVHWHEAQPAAIVQDTASEVVFNFLKSKGLQPIDLSREPEIQELMSLVDVEELLT